MKRTRIDPTIGRYDPSRVAIGPTLPPASSGRRRTMASRKSIIENDDNSSSLSAAKDLTEGIADVPLPSESDIALCDQTNDIGFARGCGTTDCESNVGCIA